MKQLYLMRHGQSEANFNKRVAGSQDSPLSPTGELQASLAGQTLQRFNRPDLIVTSPMSRALQTAHIIASELALPADKILQLQNLRERDLGDLEGLNYADAPHHNGNYEDAENAPGIEPLQRLYQRAEQALADVHAQPEHRILIICHNGIGRMLQTVVRGGSPGDLYNQARLENAVFYPLLSKKEAK